MKSFIRKTLLLALPIWLLLAAVLIRDPFKVFFAHAEYYAGNRITLNREHVCLKLYNKRPDKASIHSFIIGSSISQAFHVKTFCALTGTQASRCFHFDGNGLGLYRMHNAIRYLQAWADTLKHILLILDGGTFEETGDRKGHLYREPPQITGKGYTDYYAACLAASMDVRFLWANLDYTISGRYRDYMKPYFSGSGFFNTSNNQNGDLFYSYEAEIAADSAGFYDRMFRAGKFKPAAPGRVLPKQIGPAQLQLLKDIQSMAYAGRTELRLLLCPSYCGPAFNPEDISTLKQVFGPARVFDFSAGTPLSTIPGSYYDDVHFRPFMAAEMLRAVYGTVVH